MRRPRGRGTIERTPEGRFRARFPLGGERVEVGVFPSRVAAETALEAMVITAYEAGVSPAGGVTLLALGQACIALRRRDGYRSVRDDDNRWDKHVATWELARGPASAITRGEVRAWLAGLSRKGLAAQTRRNVLNLLRAVLEHGVELELLEENVARGVKVKDRGDVEERSTFLTLPEAERLIDAANDPAVSLAIWTGLRLGELRSLEWRDVLEDELVVRFGSPGKPPKNGKIRRPPILPQARAVLDKLPRVGPLVFPGRTPTEHRYRLASRHDWTQWLVDAGLKRRVRWHDLRHTCATLLLSGALGHAWSIEAVCEFLGHSDISVTQRYARLVGSVSRTATDAMKAQVKPGLCSALAAQVLESIGAPPTRIELVTFGLGNQGKASKNKILGHLPGATRAYVVAALEAARDGASEGHELALRALAAVMGVKP